MRLSEAALQQLLHDASQGDFDSLNDLRKSSRQSKDVFRRTLPVISHHLQTPPTKPRLPVTMPSKEDMLIALAMDILLNAATDKNKDQYPVDVFILAQASNLIRWMAHLFTIWIFDLPLTQVEISGTRTGAGLHPLAKSFRADIRASVPFLLVIMAERPGICRALVNAYPIQAGTFLSQMTVVSNRDQDIDLLYQIKTILIEFTNRAPGDAKFMSVFTGHLQRYPDAFAETFVSHIRHYAQQDGPMKFAADISLLLLHLVTCSCNLDPLLDPCLEQGGIIHALMTLLHPAAKRLKNWRGPWKDESDNLFQIILTIAHLLSRSFGRAGAPFISAALDEGLMPTLSILHRVFDDLRVELPQVGRLDIYLGNIVDHIAANVVYPSVFREAHLAYDEAKKKHMSPKLPRLSSAMHRLSTRLTEECLTYGVIGADEAHKAITKLYKYCDNIECPNQGERVRLGRCVACHSGYYCSRNCQKIIWRHTGHRQECKRIALSFEGDREGFPPVLSIHDREYLKRTLLHRIRLYTRSGKIPKLPNNATIRLDFTAFPTAISTSENLKSDGPLGIVIAKFPTGKRLGNGQELTLTGIPWQSMQRHV